MAKEYKDILYDVRDGVVRITINRPEVYNAFRNQTLEELIEALRRADEEKSANVMVLSGAGDDHHFAVQYTTHFGASPLGRLWHDNAPGRPASPDTAAGPGGCI